MVARARARTLSLILAPPPFFPPLCSLEAKALGEYFSRNAAQSPAPFIMLSSGLHMAMSYDKNAMDPSLASVADRFRSVCKTSCLFLLYQTK